MKTSRYQRRSPARIRKPVVLLATEGEKTEAIHFEMLRHRCRGVVTVLVSAGRPGESNPTRVLKRLRDELAKRRRRRDWIEGDSAWLVVDTDRWTVAERGAVLKEQTHGDFNLAASNPCFELWLLLHFRDAWPSVGGDNFSVLLGGTDCLGNYAKASYPVELLWPRIQEAIKRAGRSDDATKSEWPSPGSTQVHRAVKAILPAEKRP
jgi:hypothetical protein